MKKIFIAVFSLFLCFNAFADFTVEEAQAKLEDVMDLNGRIKIIDLDNSIEYINCVDILSFNVKLDTEIGEPSPMISIRTKNGKYYNFWSKYFTFLSLKNNILTIETIVPPKD